jgi:hypothetical protein
LAPQPDADGLAADQGRGFIHRTPLHLPIGPQEAAQSAAGENVILLRTNLGGENPAHLWEYYIRLVGVEQAFKTLKNDLAVRPIFHQKEQRIEAHISSSRSCPIACTRPCACGSDAWRPV